MYPWQVEWERTADALPLSPCTVLTPLSYLTPSGEAVESSHPTVSVELRGARAQLMFFNDDDEDNAIGNMIPLSTNHPLQLQRLMLPKFLPHLTFLFSTHHHLIDYVFYLFIFIVSSQKPLNICSQGQRS